MPATETSWQGGYAYTSGVTSYTGHYQPSASFMTIPSGSPLPSALEGTWDFSATYNEGGQPLTTSSDTLPSGGAYTLTTHYDGFANADQLSGSGTTDDAFVTASAFDDLGRTTQRTLARSTDYSNYAALVRHYGYDTETGTLDTIQAGWDTTPGNLTGNTWFQYDRYTRDAIGNVRVIEDRGLEPGGAGSDTKECFVYDNWNRLVRAHTANETGDGNELVGCAADTTTELADNARGAVDTYDRSWTFDDINRMQTSVNLKPATNLTTTWGYSGTKHAPLSLTGETMGTYSYSTVGAMTDRNADDLEYDAQQRLKRYLTPGDDDTYTYTTSNQRLIREHGTTVTLYLAGMEATWDGTTTTITRFASIAGANVATHTTRISTPSNIITVAWNCGSMQNSTICQAPAPSSANPAIPARKRYTPYGGDRNTTPYTNTDHGFLGQPDDITGLAYLNNRYYDPHLAAFSSVDPLVARTGTPFLYGNGNPITLSDPGGLASTGQCVDGDCNLSDGYQGGWESSHQSDDDGGGSHGSCAGQCNPDVVVKDSDAEELIGAIDDAGLLDMLEEFTNAAQASDLTVKVVWVNQTRYFVFSDGRTTAMFVEQSDAAILLVEAAPTNLTRTAQAIGKGLKAFGTALDVADAAAAFAEGWEASEGESLPVRVWSGLKAAAPVVAENLARAGIFKAGASGCALTGAGAIASGICGVAAVLVAEVGLAILDNNPGAPASYCSSGTFDQEQADAMGFHHPTEKSVGCL